MSFDSNSLAAIKPVLKKILEGYRNELSKFAAQHLVKTVVNSQTGAIPRLITAEMLGSDQDDCVRAPGAEMSQADTSVGQVFYACEERSQSDSLDFKDAKEMSEHNILTTERRFHARASHILGRLDAKLSDILKGNGTAGTYDLITTTALASGAEFNNYDSATSDPGGAIMSLYETCLNPDMVFVGRDVMNALRKHSKVGDRGYAVQSTSADRVLTEQEVIEWLKGFGFSKVLVGGTSFQQGSDQFALNPAGNLDGVFAMTHSDNIQLVEFEALHSNAWVEESTRENKIAAILTADIVVGDVALTQAYTNVLE